MRSWHFLNDLHKNICSTLSFELLCRLRSFETRSRGRETTTWNEAAAKPRRKNNGNHADCFSNMKDDCKFLNARNIIILINYVKIKRFNLQNGNIQIIIH